MMNGRWLEVERCEIGIEDSRSEDHSGLRMDYQFVGRVDREQEQEQQSYQQ